MPIHNIIFLQLKSTDGFVLGNSNTETYPLLTEFQGHEYLFIDWEWGHYRKSLIKAEVWDFPQAHKPSQPHNSIEPLSQEKFSCLVVTRKCCPLSSQSEHTYYCNHIIIQVISYRQHLFHLNLWPGCKALEPWTKVEKQGVITYGTYHKHKVSKITIIFLGNWIELESPQQSQPVCTLGPRLLSQLITAHILPDR